MDVVYQLLFDVKCFQVIQVFQGCFSYIDVENCDVVDFVFFEGMLVLVVCVGKVMQVQGNFYDNGQDLVCDWDCVNFIWVLYEDGSMVVYVYLQVNGVLV